MKCEKWIRDDNNRSEEWKATWWLNRLIGRKKKVTVDWPYPFAEGKLFVLTISAGLEGYHVSVDGRHVTSFPYRTVHTQIISPSVCMQEYCIFLYVCVIFTFCRDLLLRMLLDYLLMGMLMCTLYLLLPYLHHILALLHRCILNCFLSGKLFLFAI